MRCWLTALALATACSADPDGTPDGGAPPGAEPPIVLPPDACEDGGPDAPVPPAVDAVQWVFQGFDVVQELPEVPTALAFYFHGGEDPSEVMGVEVTHLLDVLGQIGVGYVATARSAGPSEQWDTSDAVASNDDVQRLDALRDDLIAEGEIDASTPIVTAGFSDGGSMAQAFAGIAKEQLGWPVVAVLSHDAHALRALPELPVGLAATEHDIPGVPASDEAGAAEHADAGFPSAYWLAPERVVTEEAFLRDATWDAEKAAEAFADLVALEIIDPAGERLVPDDSLEEGLTYYAANSEMLGAQKAEARMRVLWATHRVNGYHAAEECAFVREALGL